MQFSADLNNCKIWLDLLFDHYTIFNFIFLKSSHLFICVYKALFYDFLSQFIPNFRAPSVCVESFICTGFQAIVSIWFMCWIANVARLYVEPLTAFHCCDLVLFGMFSA